MKRLTLLLVLILCLLAGCGISQEDYDKAVDAAYDKGFSAGHDNGYIEGYETGFNDAIGTGEKPPEPPQEPTFIANKSSNVYHKPDCASVKQISEENRLEWFGSEEDLQHAGFTAHSACFSETPVINGYDLDAIDFVETPDSTAFSQIGYSENRQDLVIQFKESGAYYVYHDVPGDVWDALLAADSRGGYYNREIKGNFDCEKIEK